MINLNIRTLLAFSLFVSTALMTSCDKEVFDINSDPSLGETYQSMGKSPIALKLDSMPQFTEFTKALRYSNLFNALNQSSAGTTFTVFAPNNDAMNEFYTRRGKATLEDFTSDYIKSFVLYHTISGQTNSASFITKKSITNLIGDDIKILIDPVHAGEATLNEEARVIQMADSAANGFIYTLSRALTPLVETVYDRVNETGKSKIMTAALAETGWDKALNVVSDTVVSNGVETVRKHFYTLLNVSDAVFAAEGINSLDQLKGKLAEVASQANRQVSTDSLLQEYVRYHILPNSYTVEGLGNMSGSAVSKIIGSSARNQVMTVSVDTLKEKLGERYILNASGSKSYFVAETSNVLARNGYLHQLTSWLPVWTPEQQTVIWDLADNTLIKSYVLEEGSLYQPEEAPNNEQKTNLSNKKGIDGIFSYELGPSGSVNTSYGEVSYVVCPASKIASYVPAMNNDCVVFNVGAMGSVEMETPTLVRGKYKVELTFVYTTSHTFMYNQNGSNGGRLILSMDGENTIECAPYTKAAALPNTYTCTLWDEISFDETSTHKFKFIVNDQAASTNKNFSLQFDRITFVPITE